MCICFCQTHLAVLESEKDLLETLSQKEKELAKIDPVNERRAADKLQALTEKWRNAYQAIGERKTSLLVELSRRESCQKHFCECVAVLDKILGTVDINLNPRCLTEEIEAIKDALTDLESCQTKFESLRREVESTEKDSAFCKERTEQLASFVVQWDNTKEELKLRLQKLEELLNSEDEFNSKIAEFLKWVNSSATAFVDLYALPEDKRQGAIFEQEQLAKEFTARKSSVESLLMRGSDLRTKLPEGRGENVEAKLSQATQRWERLKQALNSQEQKIEECLKDHQTYYDSVEELWGWMQEMGERLALLTDVAQETTTSEDELSQYIPLWEEIKTRTPLFEEVLAYGRRLMEKLPEVERSEVEEQLKRFRSEWQVLNSQVVERVQELHDGSHKSGATTNNDLRCETIQDSNASYLEPRKNSEVKGRSNSIGSKNCSFETEVSASEVIQDSARNLGENNNGKDLTNDLSVHLDENYVNVERTDQRTLFDKRPPNSFGLFKKNIEDTEDFLDVVQRKVSEFKKIKVRQPVVEELLTEFRSREQDFEKAMEMGLLLVREIAEEEQFGVEEKMLNIEDRWDTLKRMLVECQAARDTVARFKENLQDFENSIKDVSSFLAAEECSEQCLFADQHIGGRIECFLARLDREQIALKGLMEGVKGRLENVEEEDVEQITDMFDIVSRNQALVARELSGKKGMLERYYEVSSQLENIEREVKEFMSEAKGLVDGPETEILESHLSESHVHLLKVLLGSLEKKQGTLNELSSEYQDVLSSSEGCNERFLELERTLAGKRIQVSDRLNKLQNALKSFKELENETNQLELEVQEAGEALSTFSEAESGSSPVEELSEIKGLEERILKLAPRVNVVKQRSLERLDFEKCGYWFQENVQCLVSNYEKAKTRVRENVKILEERVLTKDSFEHKFQEMHAFLDTVEEYLNEEDDFPGNFDVTAKEVALLNGRKFLRELEAKMDDLKALVELNEKITNEMEQTVNEERNEQVSSLCERFRIRQEELRKNVECLDETLQCFNDFEAKVRELSLLMFEVQGFLYGEGVATRGLENLIQLGRNCLENVENRQETLSELIKRVERLTDSFGEDDKKTITKELLNLQQKFCTFKNEVVNRISSLEVIASRHDAYEREITTVSNGIMSLKQELTEKGSNFATSDSGVSQGSEGSFSRRLEAIRDRLSELDKFRIGLEEDSNETKVNLVGLTELEPLKLAVEDLQRINVEKEEHMREYEGQQNVISGKIQEFEERLQELKALFADGRSRKCSEVLEDVLEDTKNLLQELEVIVIPCASSEMFEEERNRLVNRLEGIRKDCLQFQKSLQRYDENAASNTGEPSDIDPNRSIGIPDNISKKSTVRLEGSTTSPRKQKTLQNEVANREQEDHFNESGYARVNSTISLEHEVLADSSVSEHEFHKFETLLRDLVALAGDEDTLDVMISCSGSNVSDFHVEIEDARASLLSVQRKEKVLKTNVSLSTKILEHVAVEDQAVYLDNVREVRDKLATAKECLLARIEMLEECIKTKAKLEENMVDCDQILGKVEDILNEKGMSAHSKDDVETIEKVNDLLRILHHPNNSLENAANLCRALNVIAQFEETERIDEEIQELRNRWTTAIRRLNERASNFVCGLKESSKENILLGWMKDKDFKFNGKQDLDLVSADVNEGQSITPLAEKESPDLLCTADDPQKSNSADDVDFSPRLEVRSQAITVVNGDREEIRREKVTLGEDIAPVIVHDELVMNHDEVVLEGRNLPDVVRLDARSDGRIKRGDNHLVLIQGGNKTSIPGPAELIQLKEKLSVLNQDEVVQEEKITPVNSAELIQEVKSLPVVGESEVMTDESRPTVIEDEVTQNSLCVSCLKEVIQDVGKRSMLTQHEVIRPITSKCEVIQRKEDLPLVDHGEMTKNEQTFPVLSQVESIIEEQTLPAQTSAKIIQTKENFSTLSKDEEVHQKENKHIMNKRDALQGDQGLDQTEITLEGKGACGEEILSEIVQDHVTRDEDTFHVANLVTVPGRVEKLPVLNHGEGIQREPSLSKLNQDGLTQREESLPTVTHGEMIQNEENCVVNVDKVLSHAQKLPSMTQKEQSVNNNQNNLHLVINDNEVNYKTNLSPLSQVEKDLRAISQGEEIRHKEDHPIVIQSRFVSRQENLPTMYKVQAIKVEQNVPVTDDIEEIHGGENHTAGELVLEDENLLVASKTEEVQRAENRLDVSEVNHGKLHGDIEDEMSASKVVYTKDNVSSQAMVIRGPPVNPPACSQTEVMKDLESLCAEHRLELTKTEENLDEVNQGEITYKDINLPLLHIHGEVVIGGEFQSIWSQDEVMQDKKDFSVICQTELIKKEVEPSVVNGGGVHLPVKGPSEVIRRTENLPKVSPAEVIQGEAKLPMLNQSEVIKNEEESSVIHRATVFLREQSKVEVNQNEELPVLGQGKVIQGEENLSEVTENKQKLTILNQNEVIQNKTKLPVVSQATSIQGEQNLTGASAIKETQNEGKLTIMSLHEVMQKEEKLNAVSQSTLVQSKHIPGVSQVDVIQNESEVTMLSQGEVIPNEEKLRVVNHALLIQRGLNFPRESQHEVTQNEEKLPVMSLGEAMQVEEKLPVVRQATLEDRSERIIPSVSKDDVSQNEEKMARLNSDEVIQSEEKLPVVSQAMLIQGRLNILEVNQVEVTQRKEKLPILNQSDMFQSEEKLPELSQDMATENEEKPPIMRRDEVIETEENLLLLTPVELIRREEKLPVFTTIDVLQRDKKPPAMTRTDRIQHEGNLAVSDQAETIKREETVPVLSKSEVVQGAEYLPEVAQRESKLWEEVQKEEKVPFESYNKTNVERRDLCLVNHGVASSAEKIKDNEKLSVSYKVKQVNKQPISNLVLQEEVHHVELPQDEMNQSKETSVESTQIRQRPADVELSQNDGTSTAKGYQGGILQKKTNIHEFDRKNVMDSDQVGCTMVHQKVTVNGRPREDQVILGDVIKQEVEQRMVSERKNVTGRLIEKEANQRQISREENWRKMIRGEIVQKEDMSEVAPGEFIVEKGNRQEITDREFIVEKENQVNNVKEEVMVEEGNRREDIKGKHIVGQESQGEAVQEEFIIEEGNRREVVVEGVSQGEVFLREIVLEEGHPAKVIKGEITSDEETREEVIQREIIREEKKTGNVVQRGIILNEENRDDFIQDEIVLKEENPKEDIQGEFTVERGSQKEITEKENHGGVVDGGMTQKEENPSVDTQREAIVADKNQKGVFWEKIARDEPTLGENISVGVDLGDIGHEEVIVEEVAPDYEFYHRTKLGKKLAGELIQNDVNYNIKIQYDHPDGVKTSKVKEWTKSKLAVKSIHEELAEIDNKSRAQEEPTFPLSECWGSLKSQGLKHQLPPPEMIQNIEDSDSMVPNRTIKGQESVATKEDELEDIYQKLEKVCNQLALIRNTGDQRQISPVDLLDVELECLDKLQNIQTDLKNLTSAIEETDFCENDKDTMTLLEELVREQFREFENLRELVKCRVTKIETYFVVKSKLERAVEAFDGVRREEKTSEVVGNTRVEQGRLESRIGKIEKLINEEDCDNSQFLLCMKSLSDDYNDLVFTDGEELNQRWSCKKSDVLSLLNETNEQLEFKKGFEQEVDRCSQWLHSNKEFTESGKTNSANLEKEYENLEQCYLALENQIDRFESFSTNEQSVLNMLPEQERDVLKSKVNTLTGNLKETRVIVMKKKNDLLGKLASVAENKKKMDDCRSWCDRLSGQLELNDNSEGTDSILKELSALVEEGESVIASLYLGQTGIGAEEDDTRCVSELAKDMLQTAETKLQLVRTKLETSSELSVHVRELEACLQVRSPVFDGSAEIKDLEKMSEEEIQKMRHRLQEISNKMSTVAPASETSTKNEPQRRIEHSVDNLNHMEKKPPTNEVETRLAESAVLLEKAKRISTKPLSYGVDMVKMKQELSEIGQINFELKSTLVNLKQTIVADVKTSKSVADACAIVKEQTEELEEREERIAEFLSTLRYIDRSIQELKEMSLEDHDTEENLQGTEVCNSPYLTVYRYLGTSCQE